jgi:hypothetical protein
MTRSVLLLLCSCLMVWGSLGCRKEEDVTAPKVRILAPPPGASIQVPARIAVTLEISDDQKLTRVVLSLADANGVPVVPSVTRSLNGRSSTVMLELDITDERIPTGPYQLIARASDGTNDGRGFSAVTVLAPPLRNEAVLIAPPLGAPTANIMQLTPTGSLLPWSSLADMGELAVKGNTIFYTGAVTGPLLMSDLEATDPNTLALNGTPAISDEPFFHGLQVDPADGLLYVGQRDGLIRGFGTNGVQVFQAQVPEGLESRVTTRLFDRLMSAARRISDGQWILVGHAAIGGGVLNELVLDLTPVDLAPLSNDRVLIFGQLGPDAIVRSMQVFIGGTIDHAEVANAQLRSVLTVGDDHYLALSTGLMRYRHATFSLEALRMDLDVTALAWDAANGTLYCASGNTVYLLDPMTWATIASWTVPFTIGDIEVVLNR